MSPTFQAWTADTVGLMAAYSVVEAAAFLLRDVQWSVAARWFTFATTAAVALGLGLALEAALWPDHHRRHAEWLMPMLMFGFVLATSLPAQVDREISRRARAALAAEEERHRGERRLLEARLAALQGQIEPHFLFNTLANTRTLMRHDATAAETMLNHLIAYLRAAMPDLRAGRTTLGQELERTQAFLEILKIRFGARLRFSIDATGPARDCLIPPLAVMTLVENAVKHGIEPKLEGGTVAIRAHCDGGTLAVEVTDSGVGLQAETGSGVGLVNLQERLRALSGGQAELNLQPGTPCGVVAKFTLPAVQQELQA